MIHSREGQHQPYVLYLPNFTTVLLLCATYRLIIFLVAIQAPVIFTLIDACWFSSREAEYCTPSVNLSLGLPLHLSRGRLCVLQTFLHSQCRFQKLIQNENDPCPTSITLNSSADESFKHLTRAAHDVLLQANFCFWQCKARIRLLEVLQGKTNKIIHSVSKNAQIKTQH